MTTDIGEIPLTNMANVMLAVLKAGERGEASAADCLARLRRQLAQIHADAPIEPGLLEERVAIAIGELASAGLLEAAAQGRFRITPRGRTVLAEHPLGIDETVLAQFRDFGGARSVPEGPAAERGETSAAVLAPKAYLDGYGANLAGRPRSDNPYPPDSNEHDAWDAGWFESLDEAEDSQPEAP